MPLDASGCRRMPLVQKVEGRRQKAEGRRKKAEGRRQKAEERRVCAEGKPHTPIFCFKAIPHNSARADPEKIWVLIKALFRRCTLCTSRCCLNAKPLGPMTRTDPPKSAQCRTKRRTEGDRQGNHTMAPLMSCSSSSYSSQAGMSGYWALMLSGARKRKPALLAWIIARSLKLSPEAMVS